VASLEAEAQRLRAEAAAAEAETEKAAARAREEELQLVAQLRQAETEALRREGDARAAIDRKREQLAELQTVAGALRERLSQREVLQAQATELRAKLAASKGLALHKQLQAVLAENKVASARLQAQLAAAQHARTAASAELDGFTRERDALQRVSGAMQTPSQPDTMRRLHCEALRADS
jgi:colicin import membrane protein